jgi:hypothetical protein
MPKKTKKQKILAQARRIINNANVIQKPQESDSDAIKNNQYKYVFNSSIKKQETPVESKNVEDGEDYSQIKKDILKILMFTFVALSTEVLLYFRYGG